MEKPQVGIASNWWEGNPCNMHLNDLAATVREGVLALVVGFAMGFPVAGLVLLGPDLGTAALIVALCTEDAAYMTGVTVDVNGASYSA